MSTNIHERHAGPARTLIGFMQGLLIYLVLSGDYAAMFTAPAVLALVFVPALVIQGWRALAPRMLAIWAAVATAALAGLAIHDQLRLAAPLANTSETAVASPPLWFASAAGIFILQAFITARASGGKVLDGYARLFDIVWTQAVQVVAAGAFALALTLSLILGSELFLLINITFLDELIEKDWFRLPGLTTALAIAIHVTDVRSAIVRGMGTLALTLLAWLLPVMTLLALGFVAILPFTGLEPLWSTRSATALLLGVAAGLVVLTNAAYQDGTPEARPKGLFRVAAAAAALLLTPLIALAAVALSLRVGQYGWTGDRVVAAGAIVVAACFALGYGWAVLATWRGTSAFMKPLERTNIAAAALALVVLGALFAPLGDPARIGAASQLARLQSGLTAPDEFDFAYLRFDAGRYGIEALNTLAANGQAKAAEALAMTHRPGSPGEEMRPDLPRALIAAQITVRQSDHLLPGDFLTGPWHGSEGDLPACLMRQPAACDARFLDVNNDGVDEILLQPTEPVDRGIIFRRDADAWTVMGLLSAHPPCPDVLAAFRDGQVRPVPAALPDLDIGGTRVRILLRNLPAPAACAP